MKKSLGMILAATVGSLVASSAMADSGTSSTQSAEPSVKCMGANACKGQGACKTAANGCKGQNSCKGTGMVMTSTEEECTSKGGSVAKDDSAS